MQGYCGAEQIDSKKIMSDRLNCCKLLIELKADVNFCTKQEKMTPLHWAAYHNDVEVCKLLI
jgi:ankyrin repeat protein